jgi:hypothetical protein
MSEYPGLRGRDQLLKVVEALQSELDAGVEWENDTLGRYLEGLGALLGSIENAYINTGRPVPDDPWVILADVIRGATSYE